MADDLFKDALHDQLLWVRTAMLGKLDGLSEYDVRRPLTTSGTNLLGLVKHLTIGEATYFGSVFDRPYPEHLPWWDDDAEDNSDMWATPDESREQVVERFQRACAHADATIDALDLDAAGHVPWWPRPQVRLVNVIAHVLAETSRHAGHADILREQLDGMTGDAGDASPHEPARWQQHVATVEAAAREASGSTG